MSSTASVVRSPEIIFRGTKRIRAFFAAGEDCSCALVRAPGISAIVNAADVSTVLNKVREFITAIVGENDSRRKAITTARPRHFPPPTAAAEKEMAEVLRPASIFPGAPPRLSGGSRAAAVTMRVNI